MAKSPDAFRTISEVSEWLDTPAHVLRFWESKFSQIKPVKRAGGRRYYRPSDMMLLAGIKRLLHEDGLTIKGVKKILREKGVKYVASLSDREIEGYQPEGANRRAEPSKPDKTPSAADDPAEPLLSAAQEQEPDTQEPAPDADQAPAASESPQEPMIDRAARQAAAVDVAPRPPWPTNPEMSDDERLVALYNHLKGLRDRVAASIKPE
ncbi:MAG: MerR family transcriptional regulator [Paracoccaceae bacterium]|nr:MerR family transcriptional regulator [Paracoccaceae bacterium]